MLILRRSLRTLSIFALCTPLSIWAQESESFVANAPTSFQSSLEPEQENDLDLLLKTAPSTRVNQLGGFGRFSSFSLRGSDSKDAGVAIEGIRLNSPAQGTYDLSNLSLFGIQDVQIVRGGYSPFSTNPDGYVNLRLAQTKSLKTRVSYGSYDHYSVSQLTPHASFSFDRSENDFIYSSGNAFLRRTNNAATRMNLRAWHRTENYQVWGMLNVLNRELPSPTNNLGVSYQDHFQSISPLIAYQGSMNAWSWSSWAKFEEQENEFSDRTTHNRLWYSGIQLEHTYVPVNQLSLRNGFEFTQDYLFHADFDAKNRQSVSLVSTAYWTPKPDHLIHPRLRVEFVSDLNQPISAHPGIGGRHQLWQDLSALWNFSYISRAPNFNELYYASGASIANPDLEREQSIQGDVGYEWPIVSQLRLQQAFFASRTYDTIVYSEVQDGEFQSINSGKEFRWGLEQEVDFRPFSRFDVKSSYTYTRAMVGGKQRPFQPRHHLSLSPELRPIDIIEIALPVYARSSIQVNEDPEDRIDPQWNIGARLTNRWSQWMLSLEAFNLLRWKLEEYPNYPSPQETYFKMTAEYRF